jgi:hypothetical protein
MEARGDAREAGGRPRLAIKSNVRPRRRRENSTSRAPKKARLQAQLDGPDLYTRDPAKFGRAGVKPAEADAELARVEE